MRRLRSFLRDERGASLVEMSIVFPIVLVITFGLMEFGIAFWEYHTAEKATAVAARYVATRGPLVQTLSDGSHDCFVSNGSTAIGTSCGDASITAGAPYVCTAAAPGACNATVLATVITQMQQIAPFILNANVEIDVAQSKMGFVGRGRAIPLITVKTTGLTYNFIALNSLLGLGPIPMPGFATTLEAEDQHEGPGT
jgi:Flp pilus assembly protein TadG